MKIEFECPQCRSMLRLDAVHGGHQALCPVCGNAVMVPLEGNSPGPTRNDSGWHPLGPGGNDVEVRAAQKSMPGTPLGGSPVRQPNPPPHQSPWTPPTQYSTQSMPGNNLQATNTKDGLWTMALICGILSLVSHLWCGCGSLLGPVVAIMGLIATMFSRLGNKTPLLVLNGIGLLLGLVTMGLFFAAMVFAN